MVSSSHHDPTAAASCSQSTFSTAVVLYDWWLVKSEVGLAGKSLAIAGSTSERQRAKRIFRSAPIVRRLDAYMLETADGITVRIKGFINQVCTERNGFPSEVCRDFLIGFPYTWKSCVTKYLWKDAPPFNELGDSSTSTLVGNANLAESSSIINIVMMKYQNKKSVEAERFMSYPEEQKIDISLTTSKPEVGSLEDRLDKKPASSDGSSRNLHVELPKAQEVNDVSRNGKYLDGCQNNRRSITSQLLSKLNKANTTGSKLNCHLDTNTEMRSSTRLSGFKEQKELNNNETVQTNNSHSSRRMSARLQHRLAAICRK